MGQEVTLRAYATIILLVSGRSLFGDDLSSRFERLACAVIRVQYDGGSGTAFFVNDSGRLATVAHVLYERKFKLVGKQVIAEVTAHKNLRIQLGRSTVPVTVTSPTAEDNRKALVDLAMIETGQRTPCFIPLGESDTAKIGQHLISIGFPASSPAGVLYEGFLSSRHARLRLSLGAIEGHADLAYAPEYEVLRVQMPITPGASGSPVITDLDNAIGIVSEVPVIITQDVSRIAEAFGGLRNVSSGIRLSGFDVTKTLGELAWIVSQFESPGAGLAVPVSNMKAPDFLHLPSLKPPGVVVIPKPKTAFPRSR